MQSTGLPFDQAALRARFESGDDPRFNRVCGECFACCVHTGVEELKKYTGQSCRHLDGTNPTKRCSIYETRPQACQTFRCGWLQGNYESEDMRPDKSKILILPYPDEEQPGGVVFTVYLLPGYPKANIESNAYMDCVHELLQLGANEVRLINTETNNGLWFKNGEIRKADALPQGKGDYEGLTIAAYDPPIGTYVLKEAL